MCDTKETVVKHRDKTLSPNLWTVTEKRVQFNKGPR